MYEILRKNIFISEQAKSINQDCVKKPIYIFILPTKQNVDIDNTILLRQKKGRQSKFHQQIPSVLLFPLENNVGMVHHMLWWQQETFIFLLAF